MGRPSLYTPEVLETICEGLSKGIPLTVICEADEMPAPRTVMDWQASMPDVSAAIARARDAGEVALLEQCLKIADDGECDWVLSKKSPLVDTDHIQRSKLRIETRLKLLAKFNPKRWGDKLEVDNKGEMTLNVAVKRFTPDKPESTDEPDPA